MNAFDSVKVVMLATISALSVSGCSWARQMNAGLQANRIYITKIKGDNSGNPLRLAVKDNIDVKGIITTAGSLSLERTNGPAAEDAPCLAIARERRVRIVGKTNLSEFAVSPSGINEHYGTPRNPFCMWGLRIPGGSSCGSAVAIAAGTADVAFGTDTAGSIRVPAACCGIVGLKTTHGLVSTKGVYPIDAEHLDTVGPMGKNIASAVVGMDLLQRNFMSKYAKEKAAHPTVRTIRIGRLRVPGTDPKIDSAIDTALLLTGFQVVPLDAKFADEWEQAKTDGNVVAAAGAYLTGQKLKSMAGVTLRTKAVFLSGRINYLTKYKSALARREKWQVSLANVFKQVDLIVLPTLQNTPFNKPAGNLDKGLLEAKMLTLQNTVPANFSGNPALAVPIPLRRNGFGLTSLQLVGANNDEAGLLNAGRLIEAKMLPATSKFAAERLASGCASAAESQVLQDSEVTPAN